MNLNKIKRSIRKICNGQYNFFLNKKNVVGIALGYKRQNGFYTHDLCINVFVVKKISKSKLCSNDIIPPYFKGIKTDVIETGIIKTASLTTRVRPVIGGYCIGPNVTDDIIGTAGCLVTNGVSNFALSANHVLTNINELPVGAHILQPAHPFGGRIDIDSIGTVAKYMPIRFIEGTTRPTNFSDSGIVLLKPQNIMKSEIAFIGKPTCVKSPTLNTPVQQVGDISELSTGTITSIHGTTIAGYPNGKSALFKECIFTTSMGGEGDSGAILINKNKCAIGLLFSFTDNFSIYNRLDIVLDQLDVKLAN